MARRRRLLFALVFLSAVRFTVRIALFCEIIADCKALQKWYGSFTQSGSLTLYDQAECSQANANAG